MEKYSAPTVVIIGSLHELTLSGGKVAGGPADFTYPKPFSFTFS